MVRNLNTYGSFENKKLATAAVETIEYQKHNVNKRATEKEREREKEKERGSALFSLDLVTGRGNLVRW